MKNTDQKVLALKYRPENFSELIGQEIMVQTIVNSIKLNRLPNAYLLTGIRGVGKTTTARLIAKAINCKENFIEKKAGEHCNCMSCQEISKSKHLDVLEMDAASRTGIDDVRELIESSKYNPTTAKYKIFIIDEVHMLSKQAFNGLLKTLEEPPPHLKFIFATTEVKKLPVTIISRCQRFDLNRVSIAALFTNLKKISNIEKGKITEGALKLIAKAAEGSVRDSLSLLDRALVSQNINGKETDENFVREMLGIADRSKILELMGLILQGDQKNSVKKIREMIDAGVDPVNFLNDLLEMIYLVHRKINLGDFESDLFASESELSMVNSISKDINASTMVLFWQFVLKGLEELSIVANQNLALEMLIIKLVHLKDMPTYESVLNNINLSNNGKIEIEGKKSDLKNENENEKGNISKNQIKNTVQIKPELKTLNNENLIKNENTETISSLEDLINISSRKKEIELKYDLERNVNLIKFTEGNIDISLNENLGKNFVRSLSKKLHEWTGKRWVITLTQSPGEKTFAEKKSLQEKEFFKKELSSETNKKFKDIFPDGELIDVSKKD